MTDFKSVMEFTGLVIEAVGVFIIVAGMLIAVFRFVWFGYLREHKIYQRLRQDLGRGILLGLEFLVAGDIIRTVAVDHNLENVLALAVIVVVRTFLSLSLEVELEGRWPWKRWDQTPQEKLSG
jgi:uncharacterized membrane protein